MPAFVCREKAVAGVTAALVRPPSLVLVEGEAGIGKTRLMQEVFYSNPLVERTVLRVVCPPVVESFPLGPVIDGLRRLRESIGGVELSPLGGALRPLFPEWAPELPPSPEPLEDAAATRHRSLRALDELIDRLRVDIVEVEDAHRADPATLEWLLRSIGSGDHPRSVVVTYRQHDVPSGSLLWRLAARSTPGEVHAHVTLEPLDVPGIQTLVGSMLGGQEVSAEFASFLRERTGGLPLAVEECLKLLKERGDIERRGDEWARRALAEIEVPPTVRESVLERFRRLDNDTQLALKAAAVLGEPEQDALLATVAELEAPAARSAVSAACRAGLLGGGGMGRVGLRHQLAAEAIEESIPDAERRRMHWLAGNALQAVQEPSVSRLARHFKAAGDLESWARYAEATVDLSLESGDDLTAAKLLLDLLTTMDHSGDQLFRLARKLGDVAAGGAARLGDRTGLVMDVLRRVRASHDLSVSERGEIRLLLGRLLRWYGHVDEAFQEIEKAVPELDDRPGLACRAMMNLGAALYRDWPVEEHLRWIRKATDQLSKIQSSAERLNVAAIGASALLALGEEDGWSAADDLPEAGSGPFEQWTRLLSMADVGRMAIVWGRYAEARSRLNAMIEFAETTGQQRMVNLARMGFAYLAWHTGHWAGLAESVADIAGDEEVEPAILRHEACEVQALVELATGARAQAARRLSALLAARARHAPSLGNEAAVTAAALGRLMLADGAAEEAYELTEPVMATIAEKGVWLWATDVAPVHLDALIATGRLGEAEALTTQFIDWLEGRGAPAPAAASVLCRAIVSQAHGDLDEAAELFERAASSWAQLPRPYSELLALERQGRCLLAADEMDNGVAVLSDARRRLHELGAKWDADRLGLLLRQRGVEVPRHWRTGPRGYGNQLSPREQEVVALVAQGMTNQEVARVMFLSPRTVGYHLSSAMRKLGVSTRMRAAMAAADAGLIPPVHAVPVGASAEEARS